MLNRFRSPPLPCALGCVLAALGLLGCSGPDGSGEEEPERIKIQTGWYAQPETGGFFHAQAMGFFAEQGLAVDVLPKAPGGPSALQLVSSGRAQFGLTRVEDLFMAAHRGLPVVGLCAYNLRSPLSLMVHQSHSIRSFEELSGRRVKLQAGTPFHKWLQRKVPGGFQVVPHDFGLGQFMVDPTYVQQVYLTNEPYHARLQGAEVDILPFADQGFLTTDILFTTREMVESRPKLVRQIVYAATKGWYDFMTQDPTAGLELIGQLSPDLDPEYLRWTHQQMLDYRVVEGEVGFDGRFFEIPPERLSAQVAMLADLGYLPADFDYAPHVTSEFLPQQPFTY